MKKSNRQLLQPKSWKPVKGRRIVFDIAAILIPLLVILGLLLALYGVFHGRNKTPEKILAGWKKGAVVQRVFNARAVSADVFLPILTNIVQWGPLSVSFPYSWVHFFENRYGGKTLTLQKSVDARYGMHIQIEQIFGDANSPLDIGTVFLESIGLYPRVKGEIFFLDASGYIFHTLHVTREGVPMSSIFLFVLKEDYLIKIVAYAPELVYLARKSLFDAMLSTMSWDDKDSVYTQSEEKIPSNEVGK